MTASSPTTPAPASLFDLVAVQEHLTRLHEGRPFEIRAIRRRKGQVYAGYFTDPVTAARTVAKKVRETGAREVKGWFTSLNPIDERLVGRAYHPPDQTPAAPPPA